MRQMIRRMARVSDSSYYSPFKSRVMEVPEGHVPVYVGDEQERFVVKTELLSKPVFVELLRRSAQEYGYEQQGVLRIPCTVTVFRIVMDSLLNGDGNCEDELMTFIDADA